MDNCPYCGAKTLKYWHKLTPILVHTLMKFYDASLIKQKNVLHIPNDVDLTKQEYNNFQKLRFHALIAKYKENCIHKRGYWLITSRGFDFLFNRISVPKKVQTYRNHVVNHSDTLVYIKDVINSTPYVEKREDFINNSEPLHLF